LRRLEAAVREAGVQLEAAIGGNASSSRRPGVGRAQFEAAAALARHKQALTRRAAVLYYANQRFAAGLGSREGLRDAEAFLSTVRQIEQVDLVLDEVRRVAEPFSVASDNRDFLMVAAPWELKCLLRLASMFTRAILYFVRHPDVSALTRYLIRAWLRATGNVMMSTVEVIREKVDRKAGEMLELAGREYPRSAAAA